MGWETRRGGNARFYTRSKRVDGRVVREYLGNGVAANETAHKDEEKLARMRAIREEKSRLAELDELVENYFRQVSAILDNTLNAAGYRQHKRGEWRKSRADNK